MRNVFVIHVHTVLQSRIAKSSLLNVQQILLA